MSVALTTTPPFPRSHEQDLVQAESSSKQASRELQMAESRVSNAQARLKEHEQNAASTFFPCFCASFGQRNEILTDDFNSALKRRIADGLRGLDTSLGNIDEAIVEAESEVEGYRK